MSNGEKPDPRDSRKTHVSAVNCKACWWLPRRDCPSHFLCLLLYACDRLLQYAKCSLNGIRLEEYVENSKRGPSTSALKVQFAFWRKPKRCMKADNVIVPS
eukprot:6210272-Pleurochrysis_carterae.AAC.2